VELRDRAEVDDHARTAAAQRTNLDPARHRERNAISVAEPDTSQRRADRRDSRTVLVDRAMELTR
jgi:hypothetical protein